MLDAPELWGKIKFPCKTLSMLVYHEGNSVIHSLEDIEVFGYKIFIKGNDWVSKPWLYDN